jgi:hypothetical protein
MVNGGKNKRKLLPCNRKPQEGNLKGKQVPGIKKAMIEFTASYIGETRFVYWSDFFGFLKIAKISVTKPARISSGASVIRLKL